MTRAETLQHSSAAHAATAKANTDNTEASHNAAAAQNRIASEAAGLSGDNDLKDFHSDRAIQHAAAAQRCHESDGNHVGSPAGPDAGASALVAEKQAKAAGGVAGAGEAGGPGSGRHKEEMEEMSTKADALSDKADRASEETDGVSSNAKINENRHNNASQAHLRAAEAHEDILKNTTDSNE